MKTVENPWLRLPAEPPYVLPDEADAINTFNLTAKPQHKLHVDKLLPEAFVGAKDAPVILLSNNPGLSMTDEKMRARQTTTFQNWVRRTLVHEPVEYPFYYLDPVFTDGGGGNWWDRKLKHPLKRFSRKEVSQSVRPYAVAI